jgi:regulatory protein
VLSAEDGPALEPDRLPHALGVAYAYLNRREHTVSEVRRHLEKQDLDGAVIEDALGTLVDDGYLDDARFARMFVEDKRELQEWGTERIRRGLLDRGVARELIDDALQQEDGDLDRALALLGRRFPSPPRDRRERDRALGVLIRKGYDPELALDALAAYARGD